jgi:predicted transcriptional regulator
MGRKKDTDKRKVAFRLYRKETKLATIADELGVSAPLISQWKKEDSWDDKMEKTQAIMRTRMKVTEQTEDSNMLMEDELYLNSLRELESIVLEKVYTGEIEPVSWSDVTSTIKLANEQRRLILGKPTTRTETTISVEISGLDNDELDKRIEETTRAVALLECTEDTEES